MRSPKAAGGPAVVATGGAGPRFSSLLRHEFKHIILFIAGEPAGVAVGGAGPHRLARPFPPFGAPCVFLGDPCPVCWNQPWSAIPHHVEQVMADAASCRLHSGTLLRVNRAPLLLGQGFVPCSA